MIYVDGALAPTCYVCGQQYCIQGHVCKGTAFLPETTLSDEFSKTTKPVITTTNPKDLMGDNKVSLDAVSPFATIEESLAMMDGEMKYGYRNWRDKDVRARVYINACKRHLDMWLEGQERASDSRVHHLGHARACLGIILDAQATEQLVDDRNKTGDLLEQRMEIASKWVEWRKQYHVLQSILKRQANGDTTLPGEREGARRKLEDLEAALEALEA